LNLNNKFIKTLTHIRMFQLFNDSCLQLRFSQAASNFVTILVPWCKNWKVLFSTFYVLLKVFLWWCFSPGLRGCSSLIFVMHLGEVVVAVNEMPPWFSLFLHSFDGLQSLCHVLIFFPFFSTVCPNSTRIASSTD